MWISSFSDTIYWSESTFPMSILGSLVKYYLTIYLWVYFRAIDSLPLAYVSVSMLVSFYFNDYSFEIKFEIRKCDTSALLFFLETALTMKDLLWFCTNFRIVFSIAVENAIGILIGIALNLYRSLWVILTFNNINSLIHGKAIHSNILA